MNNTKEFYSIIAYKGKRVNAKCNGVARTLSQWESNFLGNFKIMLKAILVAVVSLFIAAWMTFSIVSIFTADWITTLICECGGV